MKAYKSFNGDLANATGCYGYGEYDLSTLPVTLPTLKGEARLREHGYHFCLRDQLVHHLGKHIAEIEVPDEAHQFGSNKGVTLGPLTIVRLLDRWTPQVQRLFAADCAASVLHLTQDARCDDAVRIARLFALGKATDAELQAAEAEARAAAWARVRVDAVMMAAAMAAADAVAMAAAWAAADAAEAAADAAEAAAEAAEAAADAAEAAREAQTQLLWAWLDGRRTPDDVRREMAKEKHGEHA